MRMGLVQITDKLIESFFLRDTFGVFVPESLLADQSRVIPGLLQHFRHSHVPGSEGQG